MREAAEQVTLHSFKVGSWPEGALRAGDVLHTCTQPCGVEGWAGAGEVCAPPGGSSALLMVCWLCHAEPQEGRAPLVHLLTSSCQYLFQLLFTADCSWELGTWGVTSRSPGPCKAEVITLCCRGQSSSWG